MKNSSLILILILTLALAACGGGGAGGGDDGGGNGGGGSSSGSSSSGGGSSPSPTANQTTQASNARLKLTVSNAATNNVRLDWDDTVNESTGYTIEQLSGSTWTAIATVPRPNGNATTVSWTGTVALPATLRVRANLDGYKVTLSSATGTAQIDGQLPASLPVITFDQPEPLHDYVGVSVTNPPGTLTSCVVNGVELRADAVAPVLGPGCDLTNPRSPGANALGVRFQVAADRIVEVQRSAQVRAGDIAYISTETFGLTNGTEATLLVNTASDFGIRSVQILLDGTSLGTLTAANGSINYSFRFDPRALGTGTYRMATIVTAGNGTVGATFRPIEIRNPPLITVTSPLDGALANGMVRVTGTAVSDLPGGVKVTVTLDGTQVLDTSTSPFSIDASLASLAVGRHEIRVAATGGGGATNRALNVYVVSSPTLAYTPSLTLARGSSIGAADNAPLGVVASSPGSSGWRVYLADGTTRQLDLSGVDSGNLWNWRLAQGHVFTFPLRDLLHWSPDGQRHDTFFAEKFGGAVHSVRWPWVMVGYRSSFSTDGILSFYNAETRTVVTPTLPNPVGGRLDRTDRDSFYVTPDGLVLYYWSLADGSIHRWTQATNIDEMLAGTENSSFVLTDGAHAAWQSSNLLTAMDIASSVRTQLSSSLTREQFYVANGLVAWKESSPSASAIKLWDGANTITLSLRQSSTLYGLGSDFVVYSDDSRLYAARMTGAPRLLLEFPPESVFIAGDTVIFPLGSAAAVYAVRMN